MKEVIYNYDWTIVKNINSLITTWNDNKQLIKRRYQLEVTLHRGDPDKKALFISMNPSKADSQIADATVKKIINYVYKNAERSDILKDVGRLIFATLYVVYETKPENLNDLIDTYGVDFISGNEKGSVNQNDKIIMDYVESSDVIFASWGEANIKGYKERINDIQKLLQNKTVYCIGGQTKKGFPRHLSRIDYSWGIHKFCPQNINKDNL